MAAAAAAAGCSEDLVETVPDAQHVTQITGRVSTSDYPPLDLAVVVDDHEGASAGALRADLADRLAEAMTEIATGGTARDLTTSIEARAYVVRASTGEIVAAPESEPRLVWREERATPAGASAFASAMRDAIGAIPLGATPSRPVAALRQALAAMPARSRNDVRVAILTASADEPELVPRNEQAVLEIPWVTVVVPGQRVSGWCEAAVDVGAWQLARWAARNLAQVSDSCNAHLSPDITHAHPACLPRPVARSADDRPACRVRAFLPATEPCDASRGWTAPAASDPPAAPVDDDLKGLRVCEVHPLEGEALARCLDRTRAAADLPGGWCLPEAERSCQARPRFVGPVASRGATLAVTCNLGW